MSLVQQSPKPRLEKMLTIARRRIQVTGEPQSDSTQLYAPENHAIAPRASSPQPTAVESNVWLGPHDLGLIFSERFQPFAPTELRRTNNEHLETPTRDQLSLHDRSHTQTVESEDRYVGFDVSTEGEISGQDDPSTALGQPKRWPMSFRMTVVCSFTLAAAWLSARNTNWLSRLIGSGAGVLFGRRRVSRQPPQRISMIRVEDEFDDSIHQ